MNTMLGTIPMEAVLTMLNSFNRHDRRWLAEQITAQVEREEAEVKSRWEEFRKNAITWEEEDNTKLNAFLAKIGGDWGGDASPEEIANELRQGADMVRNIDTW